MTGRTPQEALEKLARDALRAKFPDGPEQNYIELLEHELRLVANGATRPIF